MISLITPVLAQNTRFELPKGLDNTDYDATKIVVKIARKTNSPDIVEKISTLADAFLCRQFISSTLQRHSTLRNSELSNIYVLELQQPELMVEKINLLRQSGLVEYAEPFYLPKPLYVPNDPEVQASGNQVHHAIIKSFEAWEYEQGDEEIVIGILDTGVDYDHEDLVGNLYLNENDPINGVDDDGDGYIDNYHGWDFANDDNDPNADYSGHGTSVAGVSSASTNNGIGVAGTGFNVKFMPIKIFTSESNAFVGGYEAIIYAAEQGCDIINLSWGSAGNFSNFVQDIINYVVLDLDVVVIAAAGNTNAELDFYPASYEHVLSVASTENADNKANFATYSQFVDVAAPGIDYTTKNGDQYGISIGSSFSSPIVAGIAGLIRSRYPELNARQVMEKLRLATDDIYGIPSNEPYKELLGTGRINALKAVSPTNKPAIRMTELSYNNNVGPYAASGDSVFLSMTFINYLNSTTNANVSLSSESPYISISNPFYEIGALDAMESKNNSNDVFRIYIDPYTPDNEVLSLRLGFNDVNYSDYQYFKIRVNPTYLDLDNGKIRLTISSDGNLAYANANNQVGSGFIYENTKVMDIVGLGFATGSGQVVDNIVHDLVNGFKNQDFDNNSVLTFNNTSLADIDVRSEFTDLNASSPIQIIVNQKILSSPDADKNEFVIFEYRVTNVSGADITDFYTGIYSDFDLEDYTSNRASWNVGEEIGIIKPGSGAGQSAGVAILSGQESIYNAIDLGNENGNIADYSTTLTKLSKFSLMSAESKLTAGGVGSGNDVSQFLSARIPLLKNNESAKIAFVMAVSTSESNLINVVDQARLFYDEFNSERTLLETLYICENSIANINPLSGSQYRFFEDKDTLNFIDESDQLITATLNNDTSFYVVNVDLPYYGEIERVDVKIEDPGANIEADKLTVYIDESGENKVYFDDISINSASRSWDFSNGYYSTKRSPIIEFNSEGTFDTYLNIVSDAGCVDQDMVTIEVFQRSPMPEVSDYNICLGESVTINASNTSLLDFYKDQELTQLISSGSELALVSVENDTIIWTVNTDGAVNSLPAAVNIDVKEVSALFSYSPEAIPTGENNSIQFNALDENAIDFQWYINESPSSILRNWSFILEQPEVVTVSLVATNAEFCQDSVVQEISIGISDIPDNLNLRQCFGEDFLLELNPENFYYFYEDENKSEFISSGNVLDLGQLNESRTLYYTNNNQFIESEVSEIRIEVVSDFAEMNLPLEEMNIQPGQIVQLSDLSVNRISSEWYVDDILRGNESELNYSFPHSGIYSIRLLSTNDIGCMDSQLKKLKVHLVTSVENVSLPHKFTIYPVPTTDKVYLKHFKESFHFANIKIYNTQGVLVEDQRLAFGQIEQGINVSHLPPGIYTIKLITDSDQYFFGRLIRTD